VVNGTEEFQRQVATLAAVEGLPVSFADSDDIEN
jgi:Large polyvalent protein-associated domain 7